MSNSGGGATSWPPIGATVIMVMGLTGVGKSTFISQLTGEDVGIGHELTSYTKGVGIYSIELDGQIVYLVDTPGFDDTWRSDTEILKEIAFIMSQIHRQGMKVAGILYLHRISDNRVTGSAKRSFSIVKKICGPDAASRVFLVTTMWQLAETGKLNLDEARIRELLLASTPEFWGDMCQRGSPIKQWKGNEPSAKSIVRDLIALNQREGYLTHQIQREIVEEGKRLTETAAGHELWAEFRATETKCTEELNSRNLGIFQGQPNQPTSPEAELRKVIEEMKCAQQELEKSVKQVFMEREQSYATVLSEVRLQRQHITEALDEEKRMFDRIATDREDTESILDHEMREWELRRQALRMDEVRRRRSRQMIEQERDRILREEIEFREEYEEMLASNETTMEQSSDKIDKLRKRDVMKRNLFPLLGILAGTGMAVAGAVTGLVPLAGAGIGVGFTAASKINFSRRPVPDLTLGKKASAYVLEPVLSGGQGAAGTAID